jgi:hypothetical protein
MQSLQNVPIPLDLQDNDRDRRGLPIPFVVYRDLEGMPHFTINNVAAVDEVLARELCGLCGKPLEPGQIWFVGGPGSAFLVDGMYIDPFMHEGCGRYAVQVCPFLAARSYSKRIEARTLKAAHVHDDAVVHDNQITPPRPIFFAFTRTSGFSLIDPQDGSGQKYILPDRPWKDVEFWENGAPITQDQAETIAQANRLRTSALKWWPT